MSEEEWPIAPHIGERVGNVCFVAYYDFRYFPPRRIVPLEVQAELNRLLSSRPSPRAEG